MRTWSKVLLAVLLFLVVGLTGGYFYFRKKFQPAPNQLTLTALPATCAFVWLADSSRRPVRPQAALLVPVRLPGCPLVCYLQFDTGAPSTVLYRGALAALARRYPAAGIGPPLTDTVRDFRFELGRGQVRARWLRVLALGAQELPAGGSATPFVIGTLGNDLLENRALTLDFKRRQLSLAPRAPDSLVRRAAFMPLTFDHRRILLRAGVRGQPEELLFDTGSSAFALLTARAVWQQLARPAAPVDTTTENSWGKKLTSYTTATAVKLEFGPVAVPLGTVTYIEGMSWSQELLTRFSGLTGMLGNAPFADRTVILDVAGRRFGVVRE